MPFGIRYKGFSGSVIISFPHAICNNREIPSLHFKFIQNEFMKDANHHKELDLIFNTDPDRLVKVKGSVSHLNKLKCNIQKSPFNDQTSFIINLQNGLLSKQLNLCALLGYSIEPKSVVEVKKMCEANHLSHVEHICKTYIDFCEKHLLLQDDSSLSLTFRLQKSDSSFIKILCQISVYESHENQLTKLMIKFTDINFIASDCELAWTLQSNAADRLKFKKLVAAKYINIFSVRERDIIKEICSGISNTQIGNKLFISYHTVATHRKNIFKKSNCHSASSLYSFCKQRGLV